MNCTLPTATLSDAVADTVTAEPDTVAPPNGAFIDTTGGCESTTTRSAQAHHRRGRRDPGGIGDEQHVITRGATELDAGSCTDRDPAAAVKLSGTLRWLMSLVWVSVARSISDTDAMLAASGVCTEMAAP